MTQILSIETIELCDLFSPRGRNFLTLIFDKSYEMIASDIEKGVISLFKESIDIKQLELPKKRGSETSHHRLLKANAAKLLTDLGEDTIEFEGVDFSDVFGEKLKIRVECGQTDGVRLYRSLWTAKEFWLLPYPYQDSETYLYKFIIDYNKLLEEYPEGWELLSKERIKQFI